MYMLHPLGDICTVIGITIYVTKINFINLADFSFGIVPIGPFLSSLPFSVSYIFIGIGLAFMFLFNNPAKGLLPYFGGAGLWALYQFTTGIMGDVLSYLRLFALGLAGGLLGAAFNDIAFMFVLQENGTINYTNPLFLVTLIVLVLGHTINFGLAALGSFVHPLRLTFVEFYKNLEFKGGGKAYSPLGK
jgi:V/A-type H+-transporting ATPase subunit I